MSSREHIRSVVFNQLVQVVLIPEKSELKEAQLDLWWAKHDYTVFQQSAHSEIRLYSSYERVSFREAKKKLYQPSSSDRLYMSMPCHSHTATSEQPSNADKRNTDSSLVSSLSSPLLIRTAEEEDFDINSQSSSIDDSDDYLLLCVISNTYAELSQPKCRKKVEYDSFTVLIGFLSFTLPLVGYYLLH